KDTEKETSCIKKDADDQISQILQGAEKEAMLLKSRLLKTAEEKARLDTERSYISKNLEIKKEILKKKRECIDKTFDLAYQQLLNLGVKEYSEIIKKVLKSVIKNTEKYQIKFYGKGAAAAGKEITQDLDKEGFRLELGAPIDTPDAGFLLIKDKVLIDFSFSKSMNALKEKVILEISKILFE
ncbi:MAG: hypothetical protein JW946_04435, partial [Candidatus Omnitrophica bacterium]|nr:hypothetical protein [Candidatus Omnitrophota bacterium]